MLNSSGAETSSPPTTYEAGREYDDTRNLGPFGPVLPSIGWWNSVRLGDLLVARPSLCGDGSGRPGMLVDRTTVYRNGVKLADDLTGGRGVLLPPTPATYRVESRQSQGGKGLCTSSFLAWTFTSQHADEIRAAPLPIFVVRFTTDLDNTNTVAAGGEFVVPFTVQRQAGSAAGPIDTLAVDVSTDDGLTWRPAQVQRDADTGVARVARPAGTGFVSLRATATDIAGNRVEQTSIRAYRF